MIQDKGIRRLATTFGFVILMSLGTSAMAYKPGACRQDGEKLCPGLSGKELTPCLKQHETELSMACKVNLAEGREMVRGVKDACEPDIKQYCAGVQQGGGRIRKCLKAHEADLTSACKSQIAAFKEKYGMTPSTAPAK
jgi:hypothetical protein